jgi:hypothetical protein
LSLINPKPFSLLKNFTIPFILYDLISAKISLLN